MGGQLFRYFVNLINIIPRKCIDKNRARIVFVIFNLFFQKVFGLSDFQAGFITAPDGDVQFITDGRWNLSEAIGGNAAQRHFLITDLQQFRDKRRFRARQNDVGYTACFFRSHQCAPGLHIADLFGELLFAFIIIAAVTADITAVGHIVSRFAQKKILSHLLPARFDFGMG